MSQQNSHVALKNHLLHEIFQTGLTKSKRFIGKFMLSSQASCAVAISTAANRMFLIADADENYRVKLRRGKKAASLTVQCTDAHLLHRHIRDLKFGLTSPRHRTPDSVKPRSHEVFLEASIIACFQHVETLDCYGDTFVQVLRQRPDIDLENLKYLTLCNNAMNHYDVMDVFVKLDRCPNLRELTAIGAGVPMGPMELLLPIEVQDIRIRVTYHAANLFPITALKQARMKAIDDWINTITFTVDSE